jgi:putative methionine-R-sulfoxide reductase with GAF domain
MLGKTDEDCVIKIRMYWSMCSLRWVIGLYLRRVLMNNKKKTTRISPPEERLNRRYVSRDGSSIREQFNHLLYDVESRERKISILESAVRSLNQAIATEGDAHLDEQLHTQLIKALELCDFLDSGCGLIQLVENCPDGQRELVVHTHHVLKNVKVDLERLPLNIDEKLNRVRGITALAAITGETILIENVVKDPLGKQFIRMIPNTLSSLTIPLKVGNTTIGVLNLEHGDPGAFTLEHKYWVELLANLISATIHTIFQNKKLGGLRDLIAAIPERRELGEIIPKINEAITQLTGAETIIILAYDPRRNMLILQDEYEIRVKGQPVRDKLEVKLGEGVTGRAAVQRQPIYIENIGRLGKIKNGKIVDKNGDVLYLQYLTSTQSNRSDPLYVGDKLIGALNLESPRPNAFDGLSSALMGTITATVTTALLLSVYVKSTEEYTERLLDAYKMFREQHVIEKLNMLHGMVGREMIGDIDSLIKLFPSIRENERAMQIVRRLKVAAYEIYDETTLLMQLTRAEAGLGSTLEESLERVLPTVPLEGLAVHKEFTADLGSVAVAGDLDYILKNLLDNATKHVGQGNVWIDAKIEASGLHIWIWDDGPGIPKHRHTNILKHGVTGGRSTDGTGMGLSVADWCVRMASENKQSLQIGSESSKGAIFHFILPLINN